jgi:protein SCO1/2
VVSRVLLWGAVTSLLAGAAHAAPRSEALPTIGPAPAFTLTAQDERRMSLADLRGKVVVLTFIYTTCVDTCPLLTAKLAGLQGRLGADFGARVFFVSVTVDPDRDTPAVLKTYGSAHGARFKGWAFLTGRPAETREVAKRYGIFVKKTVRGTVDHTFLTSVIDARGMLRVQYMGVRFEPTELLDDLRDVLAESTKR